MMSTEHDFSDGSEQFKFIQNVLLNVIDRSVTPWVIFTGHRPMYIDSTNNNTDVGDQPVANNLRKYIEPLLLNAGGSSVDITIFGHHHSYQRMCASYQGTCMQRSKNRNYNKPQYPIPLVIGTAGPGFSMNIQIPAPEFLEQVIFRHGVSKMTVYNSSYLEFNFYASDNGTNMDILDSFSISK